MMQIRRCLAACIAALVLVWSMDEQVRTAPQAPAPQGTEAKPQAPAPQAQAQAPATPQLTPEQQDLAALAKLVDDASKGGQTAGDIPVRWVDQHFIRSQGESIYIPFTIHIDRTQLPAASAALYIRVVGTGSSAPPPAAPGERPTYAWDTINFVTAPPDGNLSRAIALAPGEYEAFIAVKEKATAASAGPARMGLMRHALTVPSFAGPELTASTVILAESVEQLQTPPPAEQQQDNPYTFGTLKIGPTLDGVFPKASQLDVLFWIYNASHTDGKPDVQVEYQFHHRTAAGELKYFNKTAPQALNAETLPAQFDLTKHQLLSSLGVRLDSFPEGDYRLEITVTDKLSGKTLVRNVDFTVSA